MKVTIAFAILCSCLCLAGTSATLEGQTIVPVSRDLPAPAGLDFYGHWQCTQNSAIASLEVGVSHQATHHRRRFHEPFSPWTTVVEDDKSYVAYLSIAYERDRKRFIMVDLRDPAYGIFVTDGWQNLTLVLTSQNGGDEPQVKHRFEYTVLGRDQFTVTYSSWNGSSWDSDPVSTCRRTAHRSFHW